MNLDFRAIRLRTRRQQGLDDDVSADIVDDVVRLTRSHTNSTTGLARRITARPSWTSEGEHRDDTPMTGSKVPATVCEEMVELSLKAKDAGGMQPLIARVPALDIESTLERSVSAAGVAAPEVRLS